MSSDTYIVRIPSGDVPRALKPEVESVLAELIPLVAARGQAGARGIFNPCPAMWTIVTIPE